MTAPVRVLVVDDQTLVRQGIRSLLSLTPEAVVVGEAADGEEALDILATEDIDVVLLDLRMPVRDGIATLKAMHERGQAVPTLVLTTFDDDALVLGALRAGAKGYMLKDVSLEQLLGGIRTLHSGGTLLQPALLSACSVLSPRRRPRTPLCLPKSSARASSMCCDLPRADCPTVRLRAVCSSPRAR